VSELRGPDPDYGLRYERQIFTCFGCDQEIERVVDANANNPVEYQSAEEEEAYAAPM
jgi:hypothetical protein